MCFILCCIITKRVDQLQKSKEHSNDTNYFGSTCNLRINVTAFTVSRLALEMYRLQHGLPLGRNASQWNKMCMQVGSFVLFRLHHIYFWCFYWMDLCLQQFLSFLWSTPAFRTLLCAFTTSCYVRPSTDGWCSACCSSQHALSTVRSWARSSAWKRPRVCKCPRPGSHINHIAYEELIIIDWLLACD